jgi:hypothetical protein
MNENRCCSGCCSWKVNGPVNVAVCVPAVSPQGTQLYPAITGQSHPRETTEVSQNVVMDIGHGYFPCTRDRFSNSNSQFSLLTSSLPTIP